MARGEAQVCIMELGDIAFVVRIRGPEPPRPVDLWIETRMRIIMDPFVEVESPRGLAGCGVFGDLDKRCAGAELESISCMWYHGLQVVIFLRCENRITHQWPDLRACHQVDRTSAAPRS